MRLQTDMKAVVLGVLAVGPRHGYGVAKAVREQSGGALKIGEGQLYPILYSLEEQGWVAAEWENENSDQPRRIYRITEPGLAELNARAERWHRFTQGVAKLIPTEGAKTPGAAN